MFSLYNSSVCIDIQTVLSVLQSVLTNIYFRYLKLLCCLTICITICIITFYYSVCRYVLTVLYYSLYCGAVSEKDEVKWNARSSFAFAERWPQTSAAHYDKYSLYKNSDCTPMFSDAVNYHSLHPDAVCTAIQTVWWLGFDWLLRWREDPVLMVIHQRRWVWWAVLLGYLWTGQG